MKQLLLILTSACVLAANAAHYSVSQCKASFNRAQECSPLFSEYLQDSDATTYSQIIHLQCEKHYNIMKYCLEHKIIKNPYPHTGFRN